MGLPIPLVTWQVNLPWSDPRMVLSVRLPVSRLKSSRPSKLACLRTSMPPWYHLTVRLAGLAWPSQSKVTLEFSSAVWFSGRVTMTAPPARVENTK